MKRKRNHAKPGFLSAQICADKKCARKKLDACIHGFCVLCCEIGISISGLFTMSTKTVLREGDWLLIYQKKDDVLVLN